MYSALRVVARSRSSIAIPRKAAVFSLRTYPRPGIRTLTTKRYTEDHETVSYDDKTGVGVVTITQHAQSALGDVVYVELPPVGKSVKQGGEIGVVESVKAVSEIYAPVSGTVEEINMALKDEPSLLNKSPEEAGWLCKIKLADPSEMERLLTQEDYQKLIE